MHTTYVAENYNSVLSTSVRPNVSTFVNFDLERKFSFQNFAPVVRKVSMHVFLSFLVALWPCVMCCNNVVVIAFHAFPVLYV